MLSERVSQLRSLNSAFSHARRLTVKRSYLKVLFPLIAIALSFLYLSISAIQRKFKRKRKHNYHQIPSELIGDGHIHNGGAETSIGSSNTAIDEEDDALTMNGGGRLALTKTTTQGSVAAIDSPKGQTTINVIELLAVLAEVAVHVATLVLGAYGSKGFAAVVSGIVVWTYILALAGLRFAFSNSRWRIPRIWNHTATLYTLQWIFSLVLFRSAIIHPLSGISQALVITDFALASLVFGIAITTRKGNKTVVLEWENDLEPSREPLASLFSIVTFGWVDTIVYQGYIKSFEIKDVWNLMPKDKAATVLADYRQFKKTTALSWHLIRYFRGIFLMQFAITIFSCTFTFAPTLLLKAILEYLEEPDAAPRNVVWLYVILLAFTDILRSLVCTQILPFLLYHPRTWQPCFLVLPETIVF
jgi:hypothetical protein